MKEPENTKKIPPLVYIEWMDTCSEDSNEWKFTNRLGPLLPCLCRSVGFLIDDSEEYKTLAQSIEIRDDDCGENRFSCIDEDGETLVLGRITIPTISITKLYYKKTSEGGGCKLW